MGSVRVLATGGGGLENMSAWRYRGPDCGETPGSKRHTCEDRGLEQLDKLVDLDKGVDRHFKLGAVIDVRTIFDGE